MFIYDGRVDAQLAGRVVVDFFNCDSIRINADAAATSRGGYGDVSGEGGIKIGIGIEWLGIGVEGVTHLNELFQRCW